MQSPRQESNLHHLLRPKTLFHIMLSAGVEPTFLPSEGSVLSIER